MVPNETAHRPQVVGSLLMALRSSEDVLSFMPYQHQKGQRYEYKHKLWLCFWKETFQAGMQERSLGVFQKVPQFPIQEALGVIQTPVSTKQLWPSKMHSTAWKATLRSTVRGNTHLGKLLWSFLFPHWTLRYLRPRILWTSSLSRFWVCAASSGTKQSIMSSNSPSVAHLVWKKVTPTGAAGKLKVAAQYFERERQCWEIKSFGSQAQLAAFISLRRVGLGRGVACFKLSLLTRHFI